MNLDEKIARALFDWARQKHWYREVAIFCASLLIWLMAGFAIGEVFPAVQKLLPMVFLPWGIVILLSEWIRRPRPFSSEHYKPLIELVVQTSSFPSQHTTIAFSLVAVFLDQPVVWPVMLLAAVFVGFGRLAVGVHYVSDVVIGAVLGFGLAYAMKIAVTLFFI